MGSKDRNRLVIVFVVVAIVALLCCLALLVAAAAAGFFLPAWRTEGGPGPAQGTARTEQVFRAGTAPELRLDNFAGTVLVRAAEGDEIQVIATTSVARAGDLHRVEIAFDHQGSSLVIETRKPATLMNAYVAFEITVPPGTRAHLHTGSGGVEVEGIQGGLVVDTGSGSIDAGALRGEIDLHSGSGSIDTRDIVGSLKADTGTGGVTVLGMDGTLEAHSGSGSIDIRGAQGQVRLDTGSGSVEYEGAPEGECRFETGTGSIVLRLPAALNAQVALDTGSGRVEIAFPLEGSVGRREVRGVIGSGQEASIYAHTGSGDITVMMR